jgi:hypothetical protein
MGQFMNRADGIRALHEASEALSRASAALHEREGGRENLVGATAEIVGGLGQAVQALAEQIVGGVSEMEEDEVLAPSMFSDLSRTSGAILADAAHEQWLAEGTK